MKRTAVILFNLGGPDSLAAVKPFLFNLFSDAAIIQLPPVLRQFVAWLIASGRRAKGCAIYEKIGGASPILQNTQAQATALEKILQTDGEVKCFTAMRYWHPFAAEVIGAVKNFAPEEIVLLPLYPQFSSTTTASSLKDWQAAAQKAGLRVATKTIHYFPEEPGFIKAIAALTRPVYAEAKKHGMPRLLLSAHGLPEKIIRQGDPYRSHCERTAAALAKELGLAQKDWVLCYQSRVGPLRWIGPSTEEEIGRAGRDHLPVIIVPVAFVNEHSETLYEIDILYRALAAQSGVPYFDRVPTVATAPEFIAALAGLVRRAE